MNRMPYVLRSTAMASDRGGCSHACLVDDVTAGEPPNIVVETAVRRLDIPECVGITDRRDDFATVADDARIVHEFGDLVLVIAPDPFDVEPIERLTETLAFVQYRLP